MKVFTRHIDKFRQGTAVNCNFVIWAKDANNVDHLIVGRSYQERLSVRNLHTFVNKNKGFAIKCEETDGVIQFYCNNIQIFETMLTMMRYEKTLQNMEFDNRHVDACKGYIILNEKI